MEHEEGFRGSFYGHNFGFDLGGGSAWVLSMDLIGSVLYGKSRLVEEPDCHWAVPDSHSARGFDPSLDEA
jgi:hypothetical protein